jgi:glycosyltransferase involved in cell wall biosynthesis
VKTIHFNDDYVLLTSAFNEEKYITKTLESVIHQTILPQRWVIVSDGSTDRTDDIVKDYVARYGFIHFMRKDKKEDRNFWSKEFALSEGFQLLANVDYSFYCTLDADVSFDETYFQAILNKFHENPNLGIAGGIRLNYYNDKLHKEISGISNVVGSVQFFRKECFESIGGFFLSQNSGSVGDAVLEKKAKKNGWTVQSFPELQIYHYRETGTRSSSTLKARFKDGFYDYQLGNMIIFEFFKSCYRLLKERPYIIGAVFRLWGYLFACFKKPEKLLSKDEIVFAKKEQLVKIKMALIKFKL